MSDNYFYKVARLCVRAAVMPFPVNEHVVEIMKLLITEEQAKFISTTFKKRWLSVEDIKTQTNLEEEYIRNMLEELTQTGLIIKLPHPKTSVPHYKIVSFFPGVLEFTLMRGEKGEKERQIALLWEKVFNGLKEGTQKNYEKTIKILRSYNIATDRVVPVQKEVKTGQDSIVPIEDLEEILEKEENIGVAVCYCRHYKDLLDEPCKKTNDRENCIILDKSAEFLIEQGFVKRISKDEALKILRKAESDGLVHKIFHTNLDPKKGLDGICSCCSCCCGTFTQFHMGATPAMSYSTNLAKIDEEVCIGCGTCVDACPMDALELDTEKSVDSLIKERCIGCGVCTLQCPEEAISLEKTEQRLVFVPPPKITN